MIAVVSMNKIKPGHYDDMHAIAINAPELFKGAKGFISAVFYSDKEEDVYGTTTVWETKEDYEAAGNLIPAETMERVTSLLREPAVYNMYYVNNAFSAD